MPTDNNYIITKTVCVGQSLAFIQRNDFVSVASQLLALLSERSLVCLISTFHTLWSPENCVPSDCGSDKLEYCTCRLSHK